jgi:hypothetical protein
MRTRSLWLGAAAGAALVLALLLLRGEESERPGAVGLDSAGGGETSIRGASSTSGAASSGDVVRRGDEAEVLEASRTSSICAPPILDVARAELELDALLEHLLRLDELRDVRAVEAAIEEFLDRWGAAAGFADALQGWLWRAEPARSGAERAALALLARCWLASALTAGLYSPAEAERFALELLQRAAGSEAPFAFELLELVLAQRDDGAAPQLVGLVGLGAALLAQLEPGAARGEARRALLELLEDWGSREPAAASLMRGLLGDPREELRLCGYRALLRADLAHLDALAPQLRGEAPELLRRVASWLLLRPDGIGFGALRLLVDGLEPARIEALRPASLARDFALGSARSDPAAFESAWRSLRGDESALGAALREGLLQGLGLARPDGAQIELLRESTFDPALRRSALQALAIVDPLGATLRARELALTSSVAERRDAILTAGNLLARESPAPELLDSLLALLEDARIEIELRELLAGQIAEHREAAVANWRRRNGR